MTTEKPKPPTMLELIEKLDKHQSDYDKLEAEYTDYMKVYRAKRADIEKSFDSVKVDVMAVAIALGIDENPIVVRDVLIEIDATKNPEHGVTFSKVTLL